MCHYGLKVRFCPHIQRKLNCFWSGKTKRLSKIQEYNLPKGLYHKMMGNLSYQYFIAVRYAGLLMQGDKRSLISLLVENRRLLKFATGRLNRSTALLVQALGSSWTSTLFGIALRDTSFAGCAESLGFKHVGKFSWRFDL